MWGSLSLHLSISLSYGEGPHKALYPIAFEAGCLQLKKAFVLVAGLSRDAIVAGTAKGILSSMPRAWDMPSVRKGLSSIISPTQVVLLQELERYNQVGF